MATKRADASLGVWKKIADKGIIKQNELFIRYIDFLIDNERSRQAFAIWTGVVGDNKSGSLIWNGSFEEKPYYGGFDWRFISGEEQGMQIGLDSEKAVYGGRFIVTPIG